MLWLGKSLGIDQTLQNHDRYYMFLILLMEEIPHHPANKRINYLPQLVSRISSIFFTFETLQPCLLSLLSVFCWWFRNPKQPPDIYETLAKEWNMFLIISILTRDRAGFFLQINQLFRTAFIFSLELPPGGSLQSWWNKCNRRRRRRIGSVIALIPGCRDRAIEYFRAPFCCFSGIWGCRGWNPTFLLYGDYMGIILYTIIRISFNQPA